MKNPNFSLVLLCSIFFSTIIHAQVAVSHADEAIVQNQTSISLAFTVPAGADRMLLVSAGSDLTPLSVTFDGNAMNLETSSGGGSLWTQVLGTSGTAISGSIVFTITGATPASYLGINAISYTGVDQATPVENVTNQAIAGGAANSNLTIASKTNDLVYDGVVIGCIGCFSAPAAAPLVGTTLESDLSFVGIGIAGRGVSGTTLGASSVSVGWTFSESTIFAGSHNGLNIRNSLPLPVELSSFRARQNKGEVFLEWLTQSEINNRGFDIERSTDGETFEKIAFVNSQGGNNTGHRYQFVDKNPPQGLLYFRLKQMDHDGTYTYSEIVSLESVPLGFTVYPNPARAIINIEKINGASAELHVFDSKGSLIKQAILAEHKSILDISDLPKGVFMLVVKQRDQLFFRKLVTME